MSWEWIVAIIGILVGGSGITSLLMVSSEKKKMRVDAVGSIVESVDKYRSSVAEHLDYADTALKEARSRLDLTEKHLRRTRQLLDMYVTEVRKCQSIPEIVEIHKKYGICFPPPTTIERGEVE